MGYTDVSLQCCDLVWRPFFMYGVLYQFTIIIYDAINCGDNWPIREGYLTGHWCNFKYAMLCLLMTSSKMHIIFFDKVSEPLPHTRLLSWYTVPTHAPHPIHAHPSVAHSMVSHRHVTHTSAHTQIRNTHSYQLYWTTLQILNQTQHGNFMFDVT